MRCRHQATLFLWVALLLVACAPSGDGPDTVNLYELVQQEGRWVMPGRDGVDIPFTGTAVSHHPNDRIHQRTQFRGGRKHGRESFWHPNGRLQFQGTYTNGLLDGSSTHWHDNDQKKREANHRQGAPDGLEHQWYRNGQTMLEATWDQGRLKQAASYRDNGEKTGVVEQGNGKIYSYYPNGDKMTEDTYVNGVREGPALYWHANGRMGRHVNYANGQPHGEGTQWKADGKILRRETWDRGRLVRQDTPDHNRTGP
tara:strand:+ start:169 stop:933 length:765 start_codon:yes stop_codon:yes gene_type:complete